jgi:GNAT superfamily N-acetyltransferase
VNPTATRTYLEMRSPQALQPVEWPAVPGIRVDFLEECPPSFWRYLYSEVGRAYRWTDRLVWTRDEAAAYLDDPATRLWLLTVKAAPAGYFELRRTPDGAVEIAYFGLLPEFVGRGLGKALLTAAVREAWQWDASRVWLHTSSLDHPAALPNYLARGFSIFKRETYDLHPPAVAIEWSSR